jgi:hypothetical protein
MKRLLLFSCVALALVSSGCLFHRKNAKPKENPKIATEVEQGFRQRWLDKRVAELTAQGVAPGQAQQQAAAEFAQHFAYLNSADRK